MIIFVGGNMNEKQFRVNDLVKFNYSEITEYVDEEHTPVPLRNDEVCELLNKQQATIKQLESDKAIAEDYANIFEMENVKLRKKLNTLSEENEQLKEQLQIIERIIETQITEKEEDLRISVKGGMPTGGLYSEIEFLEKLKKECFDEWRNVR